MAYMLYTICFLFLLVVTLLYYTRSHWVPHLPYSIADFSFSSLQLHSRLPFGNYFYTPLPSSASASDFNTDIEHGLSSEEFDLHANLAGGDSRSGLDNVAKKEIMILMRGSWVRGPMSFDEARRMYMERTMERQGIGRDGMPRDPKFVSFS